MKRIDLRKEEITAEDLFCQCGCEDIPLKVFGNLRATASLFSEVFEDYVIYITSGHRCEKHNKEVGGAENSLHIEGKALDFVLAVMHEGNEVAVPVEVVQHLLEKEFGSNCNEIILYDHGRVHFAFKNKKVRLEKRGR